MQTANAPNNTSSTGGSNGYANQTGHSNSKDLMVSILGDQYATVAASKMQQKVLQDRLAKATSSNFEARQRVVSNMNTYVAEQDQVTTHLEELKPKMHRLTLAQSNLTQ